MLQFSNKLKSLSNLLFLWLGCWFNLGYQNKQKLLQQNIYFGIGLCMFFVALLVNIFRTFFFAQIYSFLINFIYVALALVVSCRLRRRTDFDQFICGSIHSRDCAFFLIAALTFSPFRFLPLNKFLSRWGTCEHIGNNGRPSSWWRHREFRWLLHPNKYIYLHLQKPKNLVPNKSRHKIVAQCSKGSP